MAKHIVEEFVESLFKRKPTGMDNVPAQYASNNKTSAGSIPVSVMAKQMLPKDLLVHARQLDKEEINKAILGAVKSNKIYTAPPNGTYYSTIQPLGYTWAPITTTNWGISTNNIWRTSTNTITTTNAPGF